MEFTTGEVSNFYRVVVPDLHQSSHKEWRGKCPVHGGTHLSFGVASATGYAHCHSKCARGWDLISLQMELTGKTFAVAKKEVFQMLGRPEVPYSESDVESTFNYTNETGELRYQVVRKVGKRFAQRRPSGSNGWTWGLGDLEWLPYRLPEVVKSDKVLICEGEKDVETLRRMGLVATCNNGGAGNFKPELARWFTGKLVAILPDNDEKGRAHAMKVAGILNPVAKSVRIVEIPNLPEKGDVSDFVAAGGTVEQIVEFLKAAEIWTPEWEFASTVPNENDRYIRRFVDVVNECGGPDTFWNFELTPGVPTPFASLNRILGGGMRDSEVYVVAGNQGSGKTSLILQFILAAITAKVGALLFSMEMSHKDVFQRICSIVARVDLIEFKDLQKNSRNVSPIYTTMCRSLMRAGSEIEDLPLLVSTKPRVTPEFIIAESERLKRRQKIGLIVVDHMQLMAATGTVKGDYERFTSISRCLKETAMSLGVPVLLASQTTRNNASEKRTELEVNDMRGSGAIEEDAAAVMLIYPDSEHMKQTIASGTFAQGPVKSWLKVGKNRYGMQGSYLPLSHFKTVTQFVIGHSLKLGGEVESKEGRLFEV